jgi:hypothetical protein
VTVLPQALAIGPGAALAASEFQIQSVGPVLVDDDLDGHAGIAFLRDVAFRRFGDVLVSRALDDAVTHAARLSGGVVRAFLQLVQDAAALAMLNERHEPTVDDVDAAARDHGLALIRLLREGDRDALRSASGTDGIEVPLDRRLRFLSHGLLLEYVHGEHTVVRVAPALDRLLRAA